jgi:radical SAM superfamily enzyme YgiQ (UPF0313 family)
MNVILFTDVRLEGIEGYGANIPLGLLAVGTALKREGHSIAIVDAVLNGDWKQSLLRQLSECDLFGVTALTGASLRGAIAAVQLVRESYPNLPIVWGGYHATMFSARLLAEGLADFVVLGAGERVVVELARFLNDGSSTPSILRERCGDCGIAYNWKGERLLTGRPVSVELEDEASLDYSLVNVEDYLSRGEQRVLPFVTSYGCPHACTFCCEPLFSGRRWRGLSADRIVSDIISLWTNFRPDRILIEDPLFSTDMRRVKTVCMALKERGTGVRFTADMRAGDVKKLSASASFSELKAGGLTGVYMGVESGSPRTLERIRKNISTVDIRVAGRVLNEAGIFFHTSFIHDFPFEELSDSEQTLLLAEEMAAYPFNAQSHHFFTPFVGTESFGLLDAAKQREILGLSTEQMADSDTYSGDGVWAGRRAFRVRVIKRLLALRQRYPRSLGKSSIPVLSSRFRRLAEAIGDLAPGTELAGTPLKFFRMN